ncbi:NADP-dependent oxidoreductase [Sorangium sp. So ce1000]|uniref:NADP-dependent oxidoreductase n=1 Tax=Sorangium sp. So ce1000 TaxID=3133325 RepID=UPI003F6159DD
MTTTHRCLRLAARPEGAVKDSDFILQEEPVPDVPEGGVLVRTLYLSVDATQRGWMSRDTYMPAVAIGEVMRSFGVGRVIASRTPELAEGDLVTGLLGWQEHAAMSGRPPLGQLNKVPPGTPPPLALSIFGITGPTAYFGLLDIGRPQPGDTVVVSGAAGATGMLVGQIAKLKKCRVIGIAGGPTKCAWLKSDLGFDEVIDYKAEDVDARLAALCPGSIDVYFDNVGGAILDAALMQLALRARVVLCGAISEYEATAPGDGIRNHRQLVFRRARMEGFLVSDYNSRSGKAFAELSAWLSAGKIKVRSDVQEGLENAPAALRRLFTGANIGKQLVKVAED